MKYWKKKIGIGIFAGMWMMGLLACAPEGETIDLKDLQSIQSVEETFSQQEHPAVRDVCMFISAVKWLHPVYMRLLLKAGFMMYCFWQEASPKMQQRKR